MKVIWRPMAEADRAEIFDYIAQDNPAAAIDLDELFEKRAASLTEHPGLGRKGRVTGTRELVVHRHYILIYDVAGEMVRILRVLHTARLWPPVEAV